MAKSCFSLNIDNFNESEKNSPMYDNILNGVPISSTLETASPAGSGAA